MSTGSTALAIQENASPVIFEVVDSAEAATSAINHLQNTMNSGFNMRALQVMSRQFSVIQSSIMDANESLNIIDVEYRELRSSVVQISQGINGNAQAQEAFNDEVEKGANKQETLVQKIKAVAGELFSVENAKKVMDLSDELTRTTAGLDSMNDGAISTQGLMDRIYASAQNTHTPYLEAADAIAKMGNTAGTAFSSSSQLLSFMDQFNKQCVIGGASANEQSAAVETLTQAMASGTFDSGALNEILSTAPEIGSAIEQSMGWAEGSLLSYAEQGAVTAEVVKNSLLNMAGATNEKFKTMPTTFAQSMANVQNGAIGAFQPVLQKLSELASSEQFQGLVNGAIWAMNIIAGVVLKIFDLIGAIGGFISDHWSVIEPIVAGIVIAMGAYAAACGIVAFINGILAISEGIKGIAMSLANKAILIATASQGGLNAALHACPLTWIILAIIALIAIIFVLCSKIAEATGIAETGFGVICGAVNVAVQFVKNLFFEILNIVFGIANAISAVCSNIGVGFSNTIRGVQAWWYDLLSTVLTVVAGICEAMNKIPFIEFDYSGIVDKASEYASKVIELEASKEEYVDIGAVYDEAASTFDTFQEGWLQEAFSKGSEWGDKVQNNLLGGSDSPQKSVKDLDKLQNFMDTTGMPQNLTNISEGTTNIAEGTTNINDSLDVTSEDLGYLRDIAEQDAINRFTTADIKLEMNNNNTINQDTDLDGFINGLTTRVVEALEVVREGV